MSDDLPRGIWTRLLRPLQAALARGRRAPRPTTSSPREEAARDAALGERLAAHWLRRHGHRILARNLRVGPDEADLVVAVPHAEGVVLAIVEVKTSRTGDARPLLRIDAGKQRRLARLARRLLAMEAFADALIRFDALGVDLSVDPPRIEHQPACFDAAWPTDRRDRRGG